LSEIVLTLEGIDLLALYGEKDIKLNILRRHYPDLVVTSRGNNLKISGEKKDAQEAKSKIELMVRMLKERKELTEHTVIDLMNGGMPHENMLSTVHASNAAILFGRDGAPIKARTRNQKKLVDASETNDIVFAVGPAGTGKTYTAVALAVKALKNKLVKRIVLTRPAVEAGENLGFLPGDLKEKVDPYLRPLYDALDDMFPADKLAFFMQTRVIEVAPLAFMRGRTLDNAFIILDEAQNATSLQLKMFLTRIGPNAKCIITGDLTQIDLPSHQKSGLAKSLHLLEGIEGISIVGLTAEDVVRHRLVKEIIKAYDKDDEETKARKEKEKAERDARIEAGLEVRDDRKPYYRKRFDDQ
jgi:phosphate starvation-inducible protein PhoH and related proteins